MTKEQESDLHVEDKTRRCKGCNLDVIIRHNQIGGYWHLNGWKNRHGQKFWVGYCSSCFSKLDKAKKEEK